MSWKRGQTAILTPSSSSTIAALLPHLGLVAQPWIIEGRKALSLQTGSHAGILSPTDSNRPGHLVIFLLDVHLRLLIDGSVKGQYITFAGGQHLCVHVWESIGERHLWVRPKTFNSGRHSLFLTLMVYEMRSKWPYSYCLVEFYSQNLLKIIRRVIE